MIKALPFSIVLATFILPFWIAENPRPKRSLKRLQSWFVIAVVVWALLCLYLYPRYVYPD